MAGKIARLRPQTHWCDARALQASESMPTRALSQWFTQPELARRIVDWADIPRDANVLEPSAGEGAFLAPLVGRCAQIWAVEIDPRYASALRATYPGIMVATKDFLDVSPSDSLRIDLAIGNPPYEKNQDLSHVCHMLRFAPRLVLLLRLMFLAGERRYESLWTRATLRRLAVLPRRPPFKGDGDMGARSDYGVFEIVRGVPPAGHKVSVEWWA